MHSVSGNMFAAVTQKILLNVGNGRAYLRTEMITFVCLHRFQWKIVFSWYTSCKIIVARNPTFVIWPAINHYDLHMWQLPIWMPAWFIIRLLPIVGLPRWLTGRESTWQCRKHRRCNYDLWGRKIPRRRNPATHSSILAWKIPWTEEPGRLQSIGLKRVGQSWARLHTHTK